MEFDRRHSADSGRSKHRKSRTNRSEYGLEGSDDGSVSWRRALADEGTGVVLDSDTAVR